MVVAGVCVLWCPARTAFEAEFKTQMARELDLKNHRLSKALLLFMLCRNGTCCHEVTNRMV